MLFPQKTQSALEYPKILEKLADCATTIGAKKRALSLLPSDDPTQIKERLVRTEDARRLIANKGYPSFYAEEEMAASAERAEKGAVLSMAELLRIANMLRSARMVLDYIRTDKSFETVLDEIFYRLLPNRELEERITRSIISEDMLADEASPLLADIRRKIRYTNQKIRDTLQSYVGGKQIKYLQENLVTLRDGRYVVPVKAEYRKEVKGLIHDMSSSGSTLFVEPLSVVEANNDLRKLQLEETREIERILAELSAACGEFSYAIRQDMLNLTELAFIFACASFADKLKANVPCLSEKQLVRLKSARHPLIDAQKVVPIDVEVGDGYKTLVITGPNTGGKTVALKTIALLTAMTQAGLPIPASDKSEIGVFSEILVDIGDEQSIEQSLSTFSAHMLNIVGILEKATNHSLVLFDELGAGTDPVEGAALAVAVLEEVKSKGAVSVSTTHYAELKMYALDTDGVENACCEFDIEKLRPTFRLILGMPGKSNAFAISERLGLSEEIIKRAKELLSGEARRFETIVEELDRSRLEMDRNKEEAQRLKEEYEVFKRESEIHLKQKNKEAEDTIRRDREKAKQILDSTRATCEFVLKQLDDLKKHQGADYAHENLLAAKRELRERLGQADEAFSASLRENYSADEEYTLPRPLVVGDRVYVVPYAQEGVIAAIADKNGRFLVRAGIMRIKMDEKDLRLMDNNTANEKLEKKKKAGEGKVKAQVTHEFKAEIDVRGEYADDAWFKIDKYIDEALLSGVESVRIIHGKGTGKLRKAIQEQLHCDRRVRSYRNGEYGEGDLGVTVVTLH